MILRHAGGAAARCLAARCSSSARPPLPQLLLLQRLPPRGSPQAWRRDGDDVVAAVVARAAPSRGLASSSSSSCAASALTPADRHALVDLIHRFDDCLNRGRHDEVGAFFVGGNSSDNDDNNNGSAEPPSSLVPVVRVKQPGATSLVAHQGVPAIVAFFRACAPMARGNRHLILNSVVEEDGGADAVAAAAGHRRASVRSARLLVSATNPPVLRASGVIEDVMVRVPSGEWRLLSRDLLMDPPAAAAAA